jgi:hypothetical protein
MRRTIDRKAMRKIKAVFPEARCVFEDRSWSDHAGQYYAWVPIRDDRGVMLNGSVANAWGLSAPQAWDSLLFALQCQGLIAS